MFSTLFGKLEITWCVIFCPLFVFPTRRFLGELLWKHRQNSAVLGKMCSFDGSKLVCPLFLLMLSIMGHPLFGIFLSWIRFFKLHWLIWGEENIVNCRYCIKTISFLLTDFQLYWLMQVSIFFDLLFIVQHYVLYPSKKENPPKDVVSEDPLLESSGDHPVLHNLWCLYFVLIYIH